MARGNVSASRSRKFYPALVSAFLEWLITFMLFVNAMFAYLITQFARCFELPIPCLICSRLDHVFLGERVGFYGDLICGRHKLEISSLVLCRFHDKLVDVHEMCENCLFSFAVKDKSNVETDRLLVGKLGADEEVDMFQEPLPHEPTNSDMRTCYCCSTDSDMSSCYCCDQLERHQPQIISRVKSRSIESEAAEQDISLFHKFSQRGNDADSTDSCAESTIERADVDSSPHSVYSELKVNSDTESEGHIVDKKDSMALVLDASYSLDIAAEEFVDMEFVVNSISGMELEVKTLAEGFVEVRTIDLVSVSDKADSRTYVSVTNTSDDEIKVGAMTMEPPITIIDNDLDHGSSTGQGVLVFEREKSSAARQSDASEDHYRPSVVDSTSAIVRGLVELNWEADTVKVHSPGPEINQMQESLTIGDEAMVKAFPSPKLITADNVPESSSSVDDSVEESETCVIYSAGTQEVEQAPGDEVGKLNESTAADAVDLKMKADPTRVSGDLRLLWSQLSSTRGFEIPVIDSIANTSDDDIHVGAMTMEPPITIPDNDLEHGWSTAQGVLVYEREKSSAAKHPDVSEDHDGPSVVVSTSVIGHGLVELNWEADTVKVLHSPVPEINEMQESSTIRDEAMVKAFPSPKLITPDNVTESSSSVDDSVEQSDNCVVYTAGTRETEQAPGDEVGKLNESTTADADLNKKADSMMVSEDLTLLWSQLSSTRGFELPVKDSTSPRISANVDDYWKTYDPSASIGVFQKRTSLHKSDSKISLNGSSIESWDVSVVSEIEGESELDRLKRQVEHDRRLMSAVCKELEEERNASADAANQAMAMITRLQEEKSAVQMAALQDIRMMEEQAEFDVEALEKLNGLLEQKEKQIQELESALRIYQQNLPNESLLEMAEDRSGDASLAVLFASRLSRNSDCLLPSITKSSSKDWLLEIDDERLYICRSLCKLEKKLRMCSNAGVCTELPDEDGLEKEGVVLSLSKMHTEGSKVANKVERNDVLQELDTLEFRDRRGCLVRRFHLLRSGQGSSGKKEADVVTLGYELSSLSDRLLALEEDRNFLEHAIYSLSNGDEGIRFIQEIAFELRELRRIGVRRRPHVIIPRQ